MRRNRGFVFVHRNTDLKKPEGLTINLLGRTYIYRMSGLWTLGLDGKNGPENPESVKCKSITESIDKFFARLQVVDRPPL